ncbi:NAD-dependent deacetylase [Anaerotaenia torta]|uniref:NAD-dependent protein deacylase n=1 Tax=Anaerotaenia torta TaxID=433293 RepID=UPI003D261B43
MLQDKIQVMKTWVQESSRIVFFGGAGVSTESGIPDFRSVDGLYHMKYAYSPETILSHRFFLKHTAEFYEFYRDKMLYQDVKPNITHIKLAELEKEGKLAGIITQNIDGLHQKAGSSKVMELHGSVHRNHCMDCNRFYDMDDILRTEGIPHCDCGGVIKPEVVLYEEPLKEEVWETAVRLMAYADLLIIGGTSLSVYPAAGLINYYHGNKLVLVNKTVTPYDSRADLLISTSLGEVFSQLLSDRSF